MTNNNEMTREEEDAFYDKVTDMTDTLRRFMSRSLEECEAVEEIDDITSEQYGALQQAIYSDEVNDALKHAVWHALEIEGS